MVKAEDFAIERLIGVPAIADQELSSLYEALRDFANNDYEFQTGRRDHIHIEHTTAPRRDDSSDLTDISNVSMHFSADRYRSTSGLDPDTQKVVEFDRQVTVLAFKLGVVATARHAQLPYAIAASISPNKKSIGKVMDQHSDATIVHSLEFLLDNQYFNLNATERYHYIDLDGNLIHISTTDSGENTQTATPDGKVRHLKVNKWLKKQDLIDLSFDLEENQELHNVHRAFFSLYMLKRGLCRQLGIRIPPLRADLDAEYRLIPGLQTIFAARQAISG